MTTNFQRAVEVSKLDYSFADGVIYDANQVRDECYITPDLEVIRCCVRCGEQYRELNNVGRWECARHTHLYDRLRRLYECCNGDHRTLGCVRCDHIDNTSGVYPDISDGVVVQLGGRPLLRLTNDKARRFALIIKPAQVFVETHPDCVLVARESPFPLSTPRRFQADPERDPTAVREDL